MDVAKFKATGIALLDSLGERLSPSNRDIAASMLFSGEWAYFADELAAELFQDHTPVDATERDLLGELLHTFQREESDEKDYPMIWRRDEVVASLNVVDAIHRRAG